MKTTVNGMNKKTIALMVAAVMATTAFADALVYSVTCTLKTTVAARGKVKAATLTCLDESETLVYRKPGTVKIKGLIWGCGCEALSGVSGWNGETEDGCVFWDETNKKVLDGDFAWLVLNRIDSNAKKAEGAWSLEAECYKLLAGGFGSMKEVRGGGFYLNDISGNVAGVKCAPGYTVTTGKYVPCTFCSEGSDVSEETATAIAWTLCDCGESEDLTAISGTWNLRCDTIASKKLKNSKTIFDAYKFPDYVRAALAK